MDAPKNLEEAFARLRAWAAKKHGNMWTVCCVPTGYMVSLYPNNGPNTSYCKPTELAAISAALEQVE